MTDANPLGRAPMGVLLSSITAQTTFSLLLFNLYSVTDTYFVARGVGSLASAGVGVFAPVHLLLGGLATTVGAGAASVVARAMGAGRRDQSADTLGNALLLWVAASVLLSGLGLLFLDPLVAALGATPEVAPYARDYGVVLLAGTVTSTGFSSVIRANGDIRYSTLQWTVPVVVNLVLDPILIYGCHWGIRGAALATLFSQLVSTATSLYYFVLRKKTPYHLRWRNLQPRPALMREITAIGLPSFLNNLGASGVGVLFNNFLKAAGGAAALSAYAILGRLTSMLLTPQNGLMQGLQPIVGYNAGKGDGERVQRARQLAMRASMLYGLGVTALCLLLARPIFQIFTQEEAVLRLGVQGLRWTCLAFALRGVSPVAEAYFQALGQAKDSLALTLSGILLVQAPVMLAAGLTGNLTALWASSAATDALRCLLARWMLKRKGEFHAKQHQTQVVP